MNSEILNDGLEIISKLLILNAQTAPKALGREDIVIELVNKESDRQKIVEKSKEIAKSSGFSFYERDAINCSEISNIILIGYKIFYHKLDCGFCGFTTCKECEKNNGMCAVSITDAGIAIGSMIKLASIFGVDNRIMLSIGRAATEVGFFKEKVGGAYGIPLSATTKNPFFDRKIKP